MTHVVRLKAGEVDELDLIDAIDMAEAALSSAYEDVDFNGVKLDLRHARLGKQRWMARGLGLQPGRKATSLWVEWAPRNTLVPAHGMVDGKAMMSPGITLFPGDHLSIEDINLWEVSDPGLSQIDRPRATASLIVKRMDGSLERPPEPLTFAHPLLLETNFGIVQPSYWKMKFRLQELESEIANSKGKIEPGFVDACRVARELYEKLREQLADSVVPGISDAVEIQMAWIRRSQTTHVAAAFGYALARAEAEFRARPALRNQMKRGEVARGVTSKPWAIEAIEVWKRNPTWTLHRVAVEVSDATSDDKSSVMRAIRKHCPESSPSYEGCQKWLEKADDRRIKKAIAANRRRADQ
jgi:hypothetical protein